MGYWLSGLYMRRAGDVVLYNFDDSGKTRHVLWLRRSDDVSARVSAPRRAARCRRLMRPLGVVMLKPLLQHPPQVRLAEEQEEIEALAIRRLHEPLGVGVQVRPERPDRLHRRAFALDHAVEGRGELAVLVAQQKRDLLSGLLQVQGEVRRLLRHPGRRWIDGDQLGDGRSQDLAEAKQGGAFPGRHLDALRQAGAEDLVLGLQVLDLAGQLAAHPPGQEPEDRLGEPCHGATMPHVLASQRVNIVVVARRGPPGTVLPPLRDLPVPGRPGHHAIGPRAHLRASRREALYRRLSQLGTRS